MFTCISNSLAMAVGRDVQVDLPPTKRPRVEQNYVTWGESGGDVSTVSSVLDLHALAVPQGGNGVREAVLKRKKQLREYLNVSEILDCNNSIQLTFLEDDEADKLYGCLERHEGECRVVSRLLFFLKAKKGREGEDASRRFVASIVASSEQHRGHKDLVKIFQAKLPKEEWRMILRLVDQDRDSPLPSPYLTPKTTPQQVFPRQSGLLPERPMPLINLQGPLAKDEGFVVIERDLWKFFNTGDYERLGLTVAGVQRDGTMEVDCQIVAMWFNSLILMHRDGDNPSAIAMLVRALDMCQWDECTNWMILEGRIYQRMAQVYLMMGQKDLASRHFELAKEKLACVARGYDRTNMFCREAKILSATEPHRRARIEETYECALCTLEKDDPYFLASFPSVTLSKAAFHLQVAFGSKANRGAGLPEVGSEDIKKAVDTLKTIDEKEHICLEMRRFEYDFLQAELYRLQGDREEARKRFLRLTRTRGSEKVKNIISLAQQRLEHLAREGQLQPALRHPQ